MKKSTFIVALMVVFASCQNQNNDFVLKNKQVGKITDTTTIAQMKELYKNDSIVKKTEGESAFNAYDEYTIIDKNTKKALMVVSPQRINDETSKISRVDIKSDLFKTKNGISLHSNFGAFKKNQKIGEIEETFKYLLIYIDDLNATIDMSKDVLPLNARNDSSIKVDQTMIPDDANIKHFVIFMNE